MLLYRSAVMLLFQSTLPREERPYPLVSYLINLLFQSTLPREERLCQRIINMVLGYFNPRSHERSDKPFIYKALRTIISIHAPTRGATPLNGILILLFLISIHAPTRGATNVKNQYVYLKYISIHAPTRGATFSALCVLLYPPEFQSTLPREERRVFQRAKRDPGRISIHAPTRGATLFKAIHNRFIFISIHAPTRGATSCFIEIIAFMPFQSTLPREERQCAMTSYKTNKIFQSTLPREERQSI